MSDRKVVALGGGHGLAATLSALRTITNSITAVVTVADNGGSSGRLRSEFPIVPPGDLRMALAALCGDDDWGRQWAEIMQYRFTSEGDLNGHALGNLLLAALWDRDEDVVAGLDRVGALLKVVGRVLPMSTTPLIIEADFDMRTGRKHVQGQVEVATTDGRLIAVQLIPDNPVVPPEVIAALHDAEWITLGPGSWITSVLPHLLLPQLRDAIIDSPAKKIVIVNLDSDTEAKALGEYAGYSPKEHIELLQKYAPGLDIDAVIFDQAIPGGEELTSYLLSHNSVPIPSDLRDEIVNFHHSKVKLASTFAHIERESLV